MVFAKDETADRGTSRVVLCVAYQLVKVAPGVALVNRFGSVAMLFYRVALSKFFGLKCEVWRVLPLGYERKFYVFKLDKGPAIIGIEQRCTEFFDVPGRCRLRIVDDNGHVVDFHLFFLRLIRWSIAWAKRCGAATAAMVIPCCPPIFHSESLAGNQPSS